MNHHGTGALRDSIIQAVKKRASETDRELASCSVAPSLPCRKFFHVLPRFLRSTFATLHPALSTAVPRGPSSSSQDAVHLFSPSFLFFFPYSLCFLPPSHSLSSILVSNLVSFYFSRWFKNRHKWIQRNNKEQNGKEQQKRFICLFA